MHSYECRTVVLKTQISTYHAALAIILSWYRDKILGTKAFTQKHCMRMQFAALKSASAKIESCNPWKSTTSFTP